MSDKKFAAILLSVLGGMLVVGMWGYWSGARGGIMLGGGSGVTSQDCDVQTVSSVAVGPSTSSTPVYVGHSLTAWARIQAQPNGTSTVFLSFDGGADATTENGLAIGHDVTSGTATSSVSHIDFGRNTDFPYIGDVTGVTSGGTTTVLVTDCRY